MRMLVCLQSERRIFTNFHRQVFCWTDEWYGLTMKDIRAIEDKTKEELDQVSRFLVKVILRHLGQNEG